MLNKVVRAGIVEKKREIATMESSKFRFGLCEQPLIIERCGFSELSEIFDSSMTDRYIVGRKMSGTVGIYRSKQAIL